MTLSQDLLSKVAQNVAPREGGRKDNSDGKYANISFYECDPDDGETDADC